MPPQSRGSSPEPAPGRSRSVSKSESLLPPTLRPFLDNLPSPTLLIPADQRTPTESRMVVIPDRDTETPTPTPRSVRTRRAATTAFELGGDEERDDGLEEDGDSLLHHYPGEDDGDDYGDEVAGVTLDDDDFESHYSRQESPESEEDEEDVSAEEDEDEDEDRTEEVEEEDFNEEEYQNGSTTISVRRRGQQFPTSSSARQAAPGSLSRVHSLPVRPPPSQSSNHPDGGNHASSTGSGLHTSQSTTSLPPAPPPPLYPPFYNRPPTPLPPSPSLTSLLRPPSLLNRSTTSTRPTTPEDSDAETPNDTEAAVAQSARRAHPLPPTSPKVPTYEYYGFVLYLASTIAFLMYILWSYLPSPFLHAMGVTYYPNRWWSLAIPAWIVMLLIFIYAALLSYNVEYLTLPLDSLECMVDDAANVAILDERNGRVRHGGSKRLVKEMEQRAALEQLQLQRQKGKTNNNSNRRFSKSKEKEKKKRPSLRNNNNVYPSFPFHENGTAMSNGTARASSSYHEQPLTTAAAAYQQQNTANRSLYLAGGNDGGSGSNNNNSIQGQYGALRTNSHPDPEPNWKMIWNEGTDAVMDVPIGGVCEVLYG
ncbi:hypothetical protein H2204_011505 [Knufia peltigerae]|uniref:PIG-P domain-containing protein n=1 Tax=Knufia peltigerae TaxID=1002370 RepID=A0AA39CT69_9EURO|nr:hypothetical protein H2204_011505 [Knufia peltigerae]